MHSGGGSVVVILGAIVLVAAAIAALPVIWRFIKGAARVPSILEGVASEFAPNGGNSLKDGITRLALATEKLHDDFEQHRAQDKMFEEYVHSRFHDVINEQTKQWLTMTMSPEQAERFIKELRARQETKRIHHTEEVSLGNTSD